MQTVEGISRRGRKASRLHNIECSSGVVKGCLFQPGIAMVLGSSSAILSPSTIFSRTAEGCTFCRFFSVDMCGIDVNLGCWL